jgi:hypothetical protein
MNSAWSGIYFSDMVYRKLGDIGLCPTQGTTVSGSADATYRHALGRIMNVSRMTGHPRLQLTPMPKGQSLIY